MYSFFDVGRAYWWVLYYNEIYHWEYGFRSHP